MPERKVTDIAVRTPIDLFAYMPVKTTTLAVDTAVGDETVTVTDATDIVVGHAITIYCEHYIYQSLVTGINGNVLSVATPLDSSFGCPYAIVECGLWQLSVDGTNGGKIFLVKPPTHVVFNVYSIHMQIMDEEQFELLNFGAGPQLAKGMVMRQVGNNKTNLWTIVNHMGMFEYGFHFTLINHYDEQLIDGFALHAEKDLVEHNGTVISLAGPENERLEWHIRDDLTEIPEFTITVHGHLEE